MNDCFAIELRCVPPEESSGPFVGSSVQLYPVDRTGFSHHPEPKATSTAVTSADGNQRPTGPVSKGSVQRSGSSGQRKANINPVSSQPTCVQLTWHGTVKAQEAFRTIRRLRLPFVRQLITGRGRL